MSIISGYTKSMFAEHRTVMVSVGGAMFTMDEPIILLRRRLRENDLSQAAIGKLFGKSRAWASQELFADPRRVLRRLLIDQPSAVTELAQMLGWSSRDAMFQDLNVFEDTERQTISNSEGGPRQTDAERRGWKMPEKEESEPEVPFALREAIAKYGHGDNIAFAEPRWTHTLLAVDFREEPETPEDWLAVFAKLRKIIDPR